MQIRLSSKYQAKKAQCSRPIRGSRDGEDENLYSVHDSPDHVTPNINAVFAVRIHQRAYVSSEVFASKVFLQRLFNGGVDLPLQSWFRFQ